MMQKYISIIDQSLAFLVVHSM